MPNLQTGFYFLEGIDKKLKRGGVYIMPIVYMNLTEEQRLQILFFSLVMLAICGVLQYIKIKYKDKIEKCNNKIIKKIFEQL